jgi:thiol-activated cytolysin
MKNLFKFKFKFLFTLMGAFSFSCQEIDEPLKTTPDAAEINDLISTSSYNPNELLNVQNTGNSSSLRTKVGESSSSTGVSGGTIVCTTERYNLKNNFEEIAVLRPTNGIVYPGSLVFGDKSMMGGLPTPVNLDRAPVSMRLDLPGMGENGTIKVEKPDNSNVQTKLDEALNWWHENAAQEGYVNAANSSTSISTSYSYEQMSLDVGLNVSWAAGNVESQLKHESTKTEKVAMMVFKQVFYTVSLDVPSKPSDFFGSQVSLSQVESTFSPQAPPAFIHSVAYGRIIMFRMVTTTLASDLEIEGAFNYATGLKNASGTLESKYKSILNTSNITSLALGGNAEVASEIVSATKFGDLEPIIKGENAVFSKSNPGVPIAYTVRFLKDNSFAKLGYTTDYQIESCIQNQHPAREISVINRNAAIIGPIIKYTINYKQISEGITYNRTIHSGNINLQNKVTRTVPAGSFDIKLTVEVLDGFNWKFLAERNWSRPTKACYETNSSFTSVTFKTTPC